jgi:hypothetical protein
MADILEVKQNFNWEDTKRKLMLFIPCYGNKELVEYAISKLSHEDIGTGTFTIVIGNDGTHIDWSHLNTGPLHIYYFTLLHNAEQPRNGAFIRNYALKHCQAELFMQKDGEVVLEGNCIFNAYKTLERGFLWRPGNVYVLDERNSNKYMEQHSVNNIDFIIQKRIEPVSPIDVLTTKEHIIAVDGDINFTSFFHYAYCAKTADLRAIHGYDEDYKFYGFEDTDMFCRLTATNKIFKVDYKSSAIHLYHPSTVNREQIMTMGKLFQRKNPLSVVRNDENWGEGV